MRAVKRRPPPTTRASRPPTTSHSAPTTETACTSRTRKRIRFANVDPEITLIFRGDDVIGRVYDIDHRGGAGFDLKFDHHPTVYGLDDWDQVEFIVKSVTATDPHFA